MNDITLKDAAILLNVSEAHIQKLIKGKKLSHTGKGKDIRLNRDEVMAYRFNPAEHPKGLQRNQPTMTSISVYMISLSTALAILLRNPSEYLANYSVIRHIQDADYGGPNT